MSSRRSDRVPSSSAAGLLRLLERLHPDTDEAAAEYEHLRRALARFFDWRGVWPADECADEALDRLARRLEEETTVSDLRSYAYGIARLVLLERRRRPRLQSLDDAPEIAGIQAATSAPEHPRQACFDRCLEKIDTDSRALLLRYYEGERGAKIANRRQMATALGLSENALRSRVQRLRDRLEQCIERCTTFAQKGAL